MRRLTLTTFVWLVLVTLALAMAGCEADPEDPPASPTAPTGPAPLARANLMPVGPFQWVDCFAAPSGYCTFQASLKNTGSGCAITVTGSVRLFGGPTNLQFGPPLPWVLPSRQIVTPGETVQYRASFIPVLTAIQITSYAVEPLWIDTPCNALQGR